MITAEAIQRKETNAGSWLADGMEMSCIERWLKRLKNLISHRSKQNITSFIQRMFIFKVSYAAGILAADLFRSRIGFGFRIFVSFNVK